MGRFQVLRMYSEQKVVSFSQKKIINKMHADNEIGVHVHNWAKDGICAALSVNWLKKREKFREGGSSKLIQKSLGDQYLYLRAFQNTSELFDYCKLKPADDITLPILPNGAELPQRIRSWMNNDQRNQRAIYISYSCTGRVDGSHGVAARQQDNRLEFFDPNCGWYVIIPGKEEDFFRVYVIAYRDLGITLSKFSLTPVK